MILPIPGAPLSAQQVEERTQISSDGTVTTDTLTSQIHRDSAGRVRIEWYSEDRSDWRPGIVYLLDPVAYSLTTLLPEQKIAFRETVSRSSSGFQVALPGPGRPLPMVKWRTQTEALGVRVIQGVENQGTRTIQRSDEEPSVMATSEKWSAQSLGLTLEVKVTGPGWAHTVKLQNLNLHEPDLALFAVPTGYRIEDQ